MPSVGGTFTEPCWWAAFTEQGHDLRQDYMTTYIIIKRLPLTVGSVIAWPSAAFAVRRVARQGKERDLCAQSHPPPAHVRDAAFALHTGFPHAPARQHRTPTVNLRQPRFAPLLSAQPAAPAVCTTPSQQRPSRHLPQQPWRHNASLCWAQAPEPGQARAPLPHHRAACFQN